MSVLCRILALCLVLLPGSILLAGGAMAADPGATVFRRFEYHKPIYLLHSWLLDGGGSEAGYQNQEVLIQFSFRARLVDSLYFAYSQKFFWQLYDQDNSRAIRETNYNPEFFLDVRDWLGVELWRFGFWEHESNGAARGDDRNGNLVNRSRTWNRSYLFVQHHFFEGALGLGLKAWAVLDQEDSEFGSFGEDNPDIEDYLGWGELTLTLESDGAGLAAIGRRGRKPGTETLRLDGWLDLYRLAGGEQGVVSLLVQGFTGYGDSLIDYNRKIQRISVGVMFH